MDAILMAVDTGTTILQETPMFELYASTPFALDATDPRNQFLETALREARIVHDHLEHTGAPIASTAARPSPFARLRLALAGGPAASTQACSTCPA
jgi:hypothetical protein